VQAETVWSALVHQHGGEQDSEETVAEKKRRKKKAWRRRPLDWVRLFLH
jgi:hypothetical protein